MRWLIATLAMVLNGERPDFVCEATGRNRPGLELAWHDGTEYPHLHLRISKNATLEWPRDNCEGADHDRQ